MEFTRKPTMRDIAQHVGVSQTTVSFVLNNNTNISIKQSTRDAVLKAADDLGYQLLNRRTRKANAPIIGLLIDEIATSVLMADIVEGVTAMANQHGYRAPIILTRNATSAAEAALQSWQFSELAGVVHASILTGKVTVPPIFRGSNTVLLNAYDEASEFPSILPSEVLGGLTATERLLEQGCTDIIHITGEAWIEAAEERKRGFYLGLASAGLNDGDDRVFHTTFMQSAGYEKLNQILQARPMPDGIFCGNDWIAQGVYQALIERGARPGEDVKVVGYDNLFFAASMSPPLTTVNLPYREMGQLAVQMVLERANAAERPASVVRVPCELVVRNSG
ncbi:MAG: LacI family DNA-binding transcriptional regulator [Pseudomonadota bacterium]